MKITFVSSFYNHHQKSISEELAKSCEDFHFIAMKKIPDSRLTLGYADMNRERDFIIRAYDESGKNGKLEKCLEESDAVILGECPNSFVEKCVESGKPVFIFSERFFKKGTWRRFIPTTRKKVMDRIAKYAGAENLYALCASAFLSRDLKLVGFPPEKCLRWGYFPVTGEHESCPEKNNTKLKLLWAGRMIKLKHGEDALYSAAYLHKSSVDFELDLIGDGEERGRLEDLARKLKIADKVNFLGTKSPEKVRENMGKADVFLMTSDFHEGWGAVVNEAMSEGCALLASSAAGAVPFLVKDGENGLIYRYGDSRDMREKLLLLARDKNLRETLGRNAFLTVNNEYSAKVAIERFLKFAKNPETAEFESGPMSRAPVMKNKWY